MQKLPGFYWGSSCRQLHFWPVRTLWGGQASGLSLSRDQLAYSQGGSWACACPPEQQMLWLPSEAGAKWTEWAGFQDSGEAHGRLLLLVILLDLQHRLIAFIGSYCQHRQLWVWNAEADKSCLYLYSLCFYSKRFNCDVICSLKWVTAHTQT